MQFVEWGGTLPNPRRAVIGGLTGLAIALGGNLFGITSFLLGIDEGKTAGNLRLDALIPVDGFKRCYDPQNGFGKFLILLIDMDFEVSLYVFSATLLSHACRIHLSLKLACGPETLPPLC